MEQSRERRSALPLHLGVVAIEKGAFGSPSTTVGNSTYIKSKNLMIRNRIANAGYVVTEMKWLVV